MPELVDVFNEVLAEHRTKAGGCECGWARPRSEWQEPGFEEAHEAHQAEQLAARLEQVGEAGQPEAGSLFNHGTYVLHSGGATDFLIDCEALTDDDLRALAAMVAQRLTFGVVKGIPRGGMRFASALSRWSTSGAPCLLVDDVWTTGASMREARGDSDLQGVVIFARSETPEWVWPVFALIPLEAVGEEAK